MNIYLLSQTKNTDYSTYDSCVVIAETEEAAKLIHPDKDCKYYADVNMWFEYEFQYKDYLDNDYFDNHNSWCTYSTEVTCKYLGEFKGNLDDYPTRIICASYNAG